MQIDAWVLWMILAALFIIGEIFTAGFFLFWWGIGAGAAGVAGLLGLGTAWQIAVFIVVSLVLFWLSRPFAERFTGIQPPGIGADRLMGRRGVVIEEVDNHAGTGRVRVDRDEWIADSETGKKIPVGEKIEVIRVDGAHLVVDVIRGSIEI